MDLCLESAKLRCQEIHKWDVLYQKIHKWDVAIPAMCVPSAYPRSRRRGNLKRYRPDDGSLLMMVVVMSIFSFCCPSSSSSSSSSNIGSGWIKG